MRTVHRCIWLSTIALFGAGCSTIGSTDQAAAGGSKVVKKAVVSPEESQAQYQLGKYYLGQGRVGLALAAFNRSIANDPQNVEARNARGITLVRIGDIKGAVVSLEAAVASSPDTPHLLNNLAYAHMLNGSLILAAESLHKSLTLDPNNQKARENWRQLSSRAASNPALAKQLAESMPAPEPKPVVKPPVSVAPQSSAKTVYSSVSVVNIAFGDGTPTAQPVVASAQMSPIAVDIRTAAATSTLPNTLAAVVGSSVAPFAVAEAITEHPSKTTIVRSLIPSDTLALRPVMIAKKNSALLEYRPDLAGAPLPSRYDLEEVRIEVSNGNGVLNMASVLSKELKRNKLRIWRITNAKNFKFPVTRIYYTKERESEAIALGKMLPVRPAFSVQPDKLRNIDIRIVIGKDFDTHRMARELEPVPSKRNAA